MSSSQSMMNVIKPIYKSNRFGAQQPAKAVEHEPKEIDHMTPETVSTDQSELHLLCFGFLRRFFINENINYNPSDLSSVIYKLLLIHWQWDYCNTKNNYHQIDTTTIKNINNNKTFSCDAQSRKILFQSDLIDYPRCDCFGYCNNNDSFAMIPNSGFYQIILKINKWDTKQSGIFNSNGIGLLWKRYKIIGDYEDMSYRYYSRRHNRHKYGKSLWQCEENNNNNNNNKKQKSNRLDDNDNESDNDGETSMKCENYYIAWMYSSSLMVSEKNFHLLNTSICFSKENENDRDTDYDYGYCKPFETIINVNDINNENDSQQMKYVSNNKYNIDKLPSICKNDVIIMTYDSNKHELYFKKQNDPKCDSKLINLPKNETFYWCVMHGIDAISVTIL